MILLNQDILKNSKPAIYFGNPKKLKQELFWTRNILGIGEPECLHTMLLCLKIVQTYYPRFIRRNNMSKVLCIFFKSTTDRTCWFYHYTFQVNIQTFGNTFRKTFFISKLTMPWMFLYEMFSELDICLAHLYGLTKSCRELNRYLRSGPRPCQSVFIFNEENTSFEVVVNIKFYCAVLIWLFGIKLSLTPIMLFFVTMGTPYFCY